MTDEIAQLLKSLHLHAMAECLDEELAAAQNTQLSTASRLSATQERCLPSVPRSLGDSTHG